MHRDIQSAVISIQKGNFDEAEKILTPEICMNDTTAEYLRAEMSALRGQTPSAIERLTAFIERHPHDALVTVAISHLLMIAKSTNEAFDFERLSKIRVDDPYALARLIVLQSRSADTLADLELRKNLPVLSPSHWKWIGPFEGVYSRFQSELPFDADALLADTYDDNGHELKAFYYIPNGEMAMAASKTGIYVGETAVHVDATRDVLLVANSTRFYRIDIDGKTVLEHGIDELGQNTTLAARFKLTAGDHVIRIRYGLNLVEASSSKQMQMWLTTMDTENATLGIHELDEIAQMPEKIGVSDVQRIDLSHILGSNPESSLDQVVQVWTAAMMAVADGQANTAESLLLPWIQNHPDDWIARYWNARRYIIDPNIESSMRSENAIYALREVSDNAPQIAHAHLRLMQELLAQKQEKMALNVWLEHQNDLPDVADTQYMISKVAREMSWYGVADDYLNRAAQRAPNACGLAVANLKQQVQNHNDFALNELSENAKLCTKVLQYQVENDAKIGKTDEDNAQLDAERLQIAMSLIQAFPNRSDIVMDGLLRLVEVNENDATTRLMELLDGVEKSYWPAPALEKMIAFLDKLLVGQHRDLWMSLLDRLLAVYPTDQKLNNLRDYLAKSSPMHDLRVDGREIIQNYEAQNRNDAGSSVLILDYAATQFFPDGSQLGLTHQIYRVLSKEGKIEVSEVYIPADSVVLKAHTLKDKTLEVIEPEFIENKESITMPNLSIGDYVEVEYITYHSVPTGNPERTVADAFFFGGTNSPYIASVFVYEYPKTWSMDVVKTDPHHEISEHCDEVEGDRIRCEARRENIPLVIDEPLGASIYDTIPNIMLYHRYSWDFLRRKLYELITAQSRLTPYIQRYYEKIQLPESDSTWERAQAIAEFVMTHVNESESLNSGAGDTATATVTRGTGSRLMLLKALYDLAALPSYFALIRSVISPVQSDSLVALYNSTHDTRLVVETDRGPAYVVSDEIVPFDTLEPAFQNQTVIPLDPHHDIFTSRTEGVEKRRSTIDITYHIAPDGSAKASTVERVQSTRGLKMRDFLNNHKNDAERVHIIIQNMIANSYGRIDLTRFDYENLDQKQQPLVMNYDFDIAYYASTSEGSLDIASRIYAYNLVSQYATLPPAERHYPMLINAETSTQRTLTLHAPAGYTWDLSTLHDAEISTKFGHYRRHAELQDGALKVSEVLEILPQRVEVADYADFRSFCLSVDDAQRVILSATQN